MVKKHKNTVEMLARFNIFDIQGPMPNRVGEPTKPFNVFQ